MKKIYLCEQTMNGIYSALYDAWKLSRHEEAGIAFKDTVEHQLFCEYIEVEEGESKCAAIDRMIRKNLGESVYWDLYHALLSQDAERADAVFRVLLAARNIKDSSRIMEHLTDPAVEKVFELKRNVENEAHLFVEFIRFRELESGVMFSEITPKNRVLTCIGDHFSDRFPLENWIIYDKTHQEFLLHRARTPWILVTGEELNGEAAAQVTEREKEFERLWQGFFETIAIEERTNPVCQRTHLPLHFRQDMTEFKT